MLTPRGQRKTVFGIQCRRYHQMADNDDRQPCRSVVSVNFAEVLATGSSSFPPDADNSGKTFPDRTRDTFRLRPERLPARFAQANVNRSRTSELFRFEGDRAANPSTDRLRYFLSPFEPRRTLRLPLRPSLRRF
jgi:hypothetical protein